MREMLFRKVLIKSVTLLFSILVWGQPALGCDDWLWERTWDLGPEVEKLDVDLDSDLFRIIFEEESTPISVVSLRFDPHEAYH